eukprot:1160459-Pelagomonas_calceolata.AAC.5
MSPALDSTQRPRGGVAVVRQQSGAGSWLMHSIHVPGCGQHSIGIKVWHPLEQRCGPSSGAGCTNALYF